MKSQSNSQGFVRPLWLSEPTVDGGHESFFEGTAMTVFGTRSANSYCQLNVRSVQQRADEVMESNGFVTNHESKLEESLIKAVKEENLHVVEVLVDHYLQVVSLEGLLEGSSTTTTPHSSRKIPVNFLPLVIAAHLGSYDILKLFLSKGFSLESPHDVLCKCEGCHEDYFRQSQKRLDVYRAMANPMWMSLTATDPFIAAFKLSKELKCIAKQEDEFEKDYLALSLQCRQFALGLLDECTSAKEQTVVLNFPGNDASEAEFGALTLGLLHNAISYGQKEVRKRSPIMIKLNNA